MLPNPALSPNKGKLQVQFQARYAFWCFFVHPLLSNLSLILILRSYKPRLVGKRHLFIAQRTLSNCLSTPDSSICNFGMSQVTSINFDGLLRYNGSTGHGIKTSGEKNEREKYKGFGPAYKRSYAFHKSQRPFQTSRLVALSLNSLSFDRPAVTACHACRKPLGLCVD